MIWWQKKPIIDAVNMYDKISAREQKVVLITLISLLLLVSFVVVVEPLLLANKLIYSEQSSMQSINSKLDQQIENTLTAQYQDPNAELRKELIALKTETVRLQRQISLLTQALVAPKQMISLLENVLTQDKQLKLISLNNVPEKGLNIGEINHEERSKSIRKVTSEENAEESKPDHLIYQHAFEIELEATYGSSIAYLKRLDELPWQLFWQTLEYESTQYPKGRLKIRIYTLSMSKAVLGV
jgi:MSHA biogenesis protein MshJ